MICAVRNLNKRMYSLSKKRLSRKNNGILSINNFEFVFIVTYGRSGSTLIQNIIGSNGGCFIRGENYNALYGLFQSYKAVRSAKREFSGNTLPSQPWYGADEFKPHRYARKLATLFLREVLRPPMDARLVGFKEIRYFGSRVETEAFLDFITLAFPNSRIIFNKRTGSDVVNSAWYQKRDPEKVLKWMRNSDAKMHAYAEKHPDRCVVLNYDEYTRDHECLRPMFDLLKIPFDREAIDAVMSVKLIHGKPARR